ncbi:hypothetical protein FQV26_00515 [Planococcus sp. CPCC 101016]|uniref:hypothetical protein n=1 Tax=Planococcus sp. CPCC 101016 TaxID=2599617 RepID=UPI0011B68C29|nr:hypothetical protein [Planococcus sp. CPCC 101016]TWT06332.1 hypothetical protein FQV26_00515 [Planococcus sp. CPCC 101016]
MKKTLLPLLAVVILLVLPIIIWFFKEEKIVNIAIIDKTVPTESFREHIGLTWLLNHHRYVTESGDVYKADEHYYGFVPDEKAKSYTIRDLPEDLSGTDLIYLADSYGVYEEDLPWQSSEKKPGSSSMIAGGLDMSEWQTIKQQVQSQGTDLIVEFNTFASPTPKDVAQDMNEFLGLEWSGWSGRYFADLHSSDGEVPQWIVDNYEKNDVNWDFEGAGFVLVNDATGEIVVLSEEDGEVGSGGIRLAYSEQGKEHFGLTDSPSFGYWFDINQAAAGTEILANYQWDLQDAGSKKLEDAGIPENFPALFHQSKSEADLYYFAGDFVDIDDTPSFYRYSGFSKLRSFLSMESLDAEKSFYWQTYVPMMETILANTENKTVAVETGNGNEKTPPAAILAEAEGIAYPSRVNGQAFEVYQDGKWQPFTIKGVNMGMAKPGTFPGEAAITREEYERWFQQIDEMNANAIRVYTLHPPAFYEAFAAHNATAKEPLYLYHGVWIDEEPLIETLDAFTPEITGSFQAEIETIVDVIHGDAVVDQKPGHSHGTYEADISPYVIGWMIGIEWNPETVYQMGIDYPKLGDYKGTYVYTEEANPMEHWLAQQLDHLAAYEMKEHESMRPLSFTNWVTTDNLEHPAEPSYLEDLATVDPNHIKTKGIADTVGTFASYHVYPYYPDFLNLEERYTEYVDHRGEFNNYAGYLHDLQESHDMPILIAEFGVPASRGMTHENPFGWNQGFISEQQQGEIVSHLYEDIIEEGMLGGMVFTWQDEWFKRTWNTMDYDNPDERPFWSNAQTNEQQFGLLSFDRHKVKVDGEDDWTDGDTLYEKKDGALKTLTMDSDERYVYVKVQFDSTDANWWSEQDFNLYFSVREDSGIAVDALKKEEFLADFHLKVEGLEKARLLVAGDYDSFYYDYHNVLKMIPAEEKIESTFHPIRLALNKEFVRPDNGEVHPFDAYETGILRFGIANPEHEDYDSLNDYYYDKETGIMEIRIPWMLLNAKDPAKREFLGDLQKEGIEASKTIEGLGVTASLTDPNGKAVETFDAAQAAQYSWETWGLPKSEERLKESYYTLQKTFGQTE